tara:strand:- start:87 stop:374 length:288 start_codon:yes stop_codon:yes gene_type:complete
MTTTETNKFLNTGYLFRLELQKLWKYYNLMYTDESNETFDELHDILKCQLDPYGHLLDSGNPNEKDLQEIEKLARQVGKYYRAVTTIPYINWIYG